MKAPFIKKLLLFSLCLLVSSTYAQIGVGDDTTLDDMGDTFSVVAWDTVNNEVSSAGTSCVGITIDFLGDLIFDGSNNIIGAINSQASYNAGTQTMARNRMVAGDTPDEIITFLQNTSNDSGQASRQYGVVGQDSGSPTGFATAGHSGASNSSHANHLGGSINGIYYSIQGNILLNADVLLDMETAFRNAEGTLTDRMMAALNGAKRVGGDNRCTSRGNSGRASFIKARRQGEGSNYLDITLGPVADNFEPIDALFCLYYDEITPATCYGNVSSFPYVMNFEDFGWNKDDVSCGTANNSSSWIRTEFATPTASTGPSAANEGKMYMFVEGNQGNNDRATISSPCLDLPAGVDMDLEFDYHMFGSNMGQLDLDISVNGGAWSNLWTRNGNQTNNWFTQAIDLSTYAGSSIRLRFDATTGGGERSDMAVDNIRVFDPAQPVSCASPINSFPYSNPLEGDLDDWTQGVGDSGDWTQDAGGTTPSPNTGPSAPPSGSTDFWYLEASTNNSPGAMGSNATAILESPCIDLTNFGGVNFIFDYHTFGANIGDILVQVSEIEGSWTTLFTTPGTSANTWITQNVDLSTFNSVIKLRIVGNTGGGFASDLAIDNLRLEIPCTASTTWNGASWNNGAPDANTSATLNGNYNTGTHGAITACELTINSSRTLIVNAGALNAVVVSNDITVNGTLTIEHQGNVVQYASDSAVANNGTIQVNVTSPTLGGRDFMILGSPTTAEDRNGLLVSGNAGVVREHSTGQFEPNPQVAIQFPGAENFADDNANTTHSWGLHTGVLEPGEGYFVRPQPNNNSADATYDFRFDTGTLNTGDISFSAIMGFDGTQNGSPNFVANPYPSAISAKEFMGVNNIDEIFFWEHNTQPSGAFPGAISTNFTMEDISTLNAAGVGNAAATGGLVPGDIISTSQGFGFKAAAASTINFTNGMRRTTANNTLRNGELLERDIVRLQIMSTQYERGATTTMAFLNEATANFDEGLDTKRLATAVSIYSQLEDGSKEFGIQSREAFSDGIKIPVGYSTMIDELTTYTIGLSDVQGSNLSTSEVYLYDNLLSTVTNLTETDYEFTSEKGNFNGRFTVQFKNENVLSNPESNFEDGITVFPNPTNGILNIVSKNSDLKSVDVYDVQGRKVNVTIGNSNENTTIDISDLNGAMYFVVINTTEGSVTKKIMKN